MQRILKRIGAGLLTPAAAALLLMGCEVKNPGAILDVDLNSEETMAALVTGMSADFSLAVDELVFDMSRGSDNLTGSGSYFETGLLRNGVVNREDQNFEWGALHQARWVAEDGILRMREVFGPEGTGTYDGHPYVARAFLLAALAHRMSGECLCFAVIDSSAAGPRTAHFDSALVRADSAIYHANLAGLDSLVEAAHGVKAQAHAALGNWSSATTEAQQVDTDFLYVAFASANSSRENNQSRVETYNRAEMSAWGTVAGSFSAMSGSWGQGDPRAPFIDCTLGSSECISTQGADGETDHWQQMKYPDLGTDYPVIKGAEMRLIEAEALLEGGAGNIAAAVAEIDEGRAEYGLGGVAPVPATINDAWILLDQERHLTLWMEARRWWDAYRWSAAGRTFMPAVQYIDGNDVSLYPTGTVSYKYPKDPNIPQRRTCLPISLAECQSNPNVLGSAQCAGDWVGP